VDQLDVLRGQQALRQITPAVEIRGGAQIKTGEMQQVEAHQHHGRFALCGCDLFRCLELCPILQGVERRPPVGTERHDFSVEDHRVGGFGRKVGDDFRKERRQVDATA
jgi:hypothetical protein